MSESGELKDDVRFTDLPGYELVQKGLRDLAAGVDSQEALLVAIGSPRLRRVGLLVPGREQLPVEPEMNLYRLLRQTRPLDAYGAYNALLRRLMKFERALEQATTQRR